VAKPSSAANGTTPMKDEDEDDEGDVSPSPSARL